MLGPQGDRSVMLDQALLPLVHPACLLASFLLESFGTSRCDRHT